MGSNARRNAVFWVFFVMVSLVAGLVCWHVADACTNSGSDSSEVAAAVQAGKEAIEDYNKAVEEGNVAKTDAIPGSVLVHSLDSLIEQADWVVVDDGSGGLGGYSLTAEDVDRQYDRINILKGYTKDIRGYVKRINEEKISKPLSDAKTALIAKRDEVKEYLSGVQDGSLLTDDYYLKGELRDAVNSADSLLEGSDTAAINAKVGDLDAKVKAVKDAQQRKIDDDKKKEEEQRQQKEKEDGYSQAQSVLNDESLSFQQRIDALRDIPSVEEQGLKYVCELAGGTYQGSETSGECYAN